MDESLDYHPDSGSGDYEAAQKDANAPEQSHGDVGATTFNPHDAPDRRSDEFNRLEKRHHEHWSKSGGDQLKTDIAYDARMVCDRLELTDVQSERVHRLLPEHLQSGRPYELTIVGVVTYVLNEDGRWIQRERGTVDLDTNGGSSDERSETTSHDGDVVGDPLHDQWKAICESFDIRPWRVSSVVEDVWESLNG